MKMLTDDGRTMDAGDYHPIISPGAFGSGELKRGRQRKRWEDNIKEWTGMDFASSTRVAENRSRWNGIVANSSVVPRRPSKVTG